jgi:pimeloyl-ACP methyl ester carboxylesterase
MRRRHTDCAGYAERGQPEVNPVTFAAHCILCLLVLQPAPIPNGSDKITVKAGNHDLTVFTYKPESYRDGPLVLVFHGTNRNADEYRDWAKVIGDQLGAVIAAPHFDAKTFPSSLYQMGGLMQAGKPRPRDEWTWSLVPKIADELRKREGRPDMPYHLIGHSAGGQFLIRLAGFVKTDAARIVVSNPGSLLFATTEMPFPYGYGQLPEELNGDAALQLFLAQPLTLYLGTGDTIQDKYFPKGPLAARQGDSRYERGKNAFKTAEALAKEKNWTFNWKVVEAEGVGHNAAEMFRNAKCPDALGLVVRPRP